MSCFFIKREYKVLIELAKRGATCEPEFMPDNWKGNNMFMNRLKVNF
jgi:hypothetical protein